MAVAFLMTTPTTEQLAAAEAGRGLLVAGAHSVAWPTAGRACRSSVGARSGVISARRTSSASTGCRSCRWSAGCWCSCALRWLDEAHRSALVIVAGLSYIAVVTALTWQALRGQALIAPDAWTLAALGAIVAAAGAAGVGVVAHARRRRRG